MRMRVFLGGAAVRGPARVPDAVDAIEGSIAGWLLRDYAVCRRRAEYRASRSADDRDSCRIIAAVFEPSEAVENQRDNFFRSDISNNAAHGEISLSSLSRAGDARDAVSSMPGAVND